MQSLVRRSVGAAAARQPSARTLHSLSHRLSSAAKGKAPGSSPAAPAAGGVKKTTANTAADLRRIFREQQRASFVASEAFPWEVTEQKVTGQNNRRTSVRRWLTGTDGDTKTLTQSVETK